MRYLVPWRLTQFCSSIFLRQCKITTSPHLPSKLGGRIQDVNKGYVFQKGAISAESIVPKPQYFFLPFRITATRTPSQINRRVIHKHPNTLSDKHHERLKRFQVNKRKYFLERPDSYRPRLDQRFSLLFRFSLLHLICYDTFLYYTWGTVQNARDCALSK